MWSGAMFFYVWYDLLATPANEAEFMRSSRFVSLSDGVQYVSRKQLCTDLYEIFTEGVP